jgi:hypothetical protein
MANTTKASEAADNTLLILSFLLNIFSQIEGFLANKKVQELLSDEELLNATLEKAGKNREEAERIKARLRSLTEGG